MSTPTNDGGAEFEPFDLVYALDNAAEFLENEEWPDDGGKQEAANREGAKRIGAMANRYAKKHGMAARNQTTK